MKLDLSAHDEDAHGAIKTADGRLVVPFVLLLATLKGDRPWRLAMKACIDALRQASPQEWATLSPGGWAVCTSSFRQFMFPPPDSSTETQSQLDALQKHAGSVRDLSSLTAACGSFAIDLEDVRRVFPELEIVGDHGAEAIFRRMESAGVWPRRKAEKSRKVQAWTDDERAAAFELRSVLKASEAILLERIGVTRQALNLAIGGATAPLTNSWPECWRPSPELLRRGGFPVAELTLQDACKPAPKGARKAA